MVGTNSEVLAQVVDQSRVIGFPSVSPNINTPRSGGLTLRLIVQFPDKNECALQRKRELFHNFFLSVTGRMDKPDNTFVILFTKSAPDSGVDLLFALWGIIGRASNFSGTSLVVVGYKSS
jgi:hypothetical protein